MRKMKQQRARALAAILASQIWACAEAGGPEVLSDDEQAVAGEETVTGKSEALVSFCNQHSGDYFTSPDPDVWSGKAVCLNHYYEHTPYVIHTSKVFFPPVSGRACSDNKIKVTVKRLTGAPQQTVSFSASGKFVGLACMATLSIGVHGEGQRYSFSILPNALAVPTITSTVDPWP